MAEFSAADVALTGFRVVWERPRVLAFWIPLQLLFSLALTVFVAVEVWPTFAQLMALVQTAQPDVGRFQQLVGQLAPTDIPLIAFGLVTAAITTAAMNRAVLRPEDSAFGYVRVSSDELRQLGLFASIAIAIGLSIIAVLLLVRMTGGVLGAMVLLIAAPGLICGCIYAGVRISLASAVTFSIGRIDFATSWRLTHGRFWPLFGTYALAFVLKLVVFVLTTAIAGMLTYLVASVLHEAPTTAQAAGSLAVLLSPSGLTNLAISACGAALSWPITATPPAAVYRALTGDTVSRTFA